MKTSDYEGKTDEQVWNEWTNEQKEHFLADHSNEFKNVDWEWEKYERDDQPTYYNIAKRFMYEDLPHLVKLSLREHLSF